MINNSTPDRTQDMRPDEQPSHAELQAKYLDGPVDAWKDLGGQVNRDDPELLETTSRHPAAHVTNPEEDAAWQRELDRKRANQQAAGPLGYLTIVKLNANEQRFIRQNPTTKQIRKGH